MTKRILILNDDGTATVGGVMCKLVRLSDLHFLPVHLRVDLLKDAAAIDLSSLPRAEGDWSALFDERAK